MRRPTRALPALALAAAMVPALAGCGEKSEPETTGPVVPQATSPIDGGTTTTTPVRDDEELASAAARAYLTSPDAAQVCDEVIAPELLTRAYGNRNGCLTARKPATLARTATINDVQVQGTTATVTARASGGRYGNGEPVRLTLVRQGDAWFVLRVR